MSRFTAIPAVPTGLNEWQNQLLNALKEDVELLCGIRGEADAASQAVTRSTITVLEANEMTLKRVTAEGKGYTISGQNVADLDDYAKLITNVQDLANDVAYLRSIINVLISQLKG
jgi:hypothetical protein